MITTFGIIMFGLSALFLAAAFILRIRSKRKAKLRDGVIVSGEIVATGRIREEPYPYVEPKMRTSARLRSGYSGRSSFSDSPADVYPSGYFDNIEPFSHPVNDPEPSGSSFDFGGGSFSGGGAEGSYGNDSSSIDSYDSGSSDSSSGSDD